ncbi:C2 domain-containing protein [Actinidia rufa]|uniref:C2 domain-containing protein n=1 Tax=Actinidia rufa TaxID=165716 RepID=A0A7J0E848_9ERIC|nr:C2 domain-containing protein [Actinidia rufa]
MCWVLVRSRGGETQKAPGHVLTLVEPWGAHSMEGAHSTEGIVLWRDHFAEGLVSWTAYSCGGNSLRGEGDSHHGGLKHIFQAWVSRDCYSMELVSRVRYMFASFWNRNHALRALQRAVNNFHAMVEAEKKEKEQSALRAHSSSVRGSKRRAKIPEESVPKTLKFQPFIKEEVLVAIYNDVFPSTAEQFFDLLLNDGSSYINEYRAVRKDTNLTLTLPHILLSAIQVSEQELDPFKGRAHGESQCWHN